MGWKIDRISMGAFGLDGGAMFGIVPKSIWEKLIPADEKNRIPMQTNCMLLQQKDRRVIVETGCGFDFDEKMRSIYDLKELTSWQTVLEPFELKPDDITDVFVTHLHFDHAGGLSYCAPSGERRLSFAKATHYVQKKHLECALNATAKDGASFLKTSVWPFQEGKAKSNLLEGCGQPLDGINVEVVDGHTKSQQVIHVQGEKGHWVFVSDLIPTTAHLHLPYNMAYDNFPLSTIEEKRALLTKAVDRDWNLWFYHDPKVVAAKVAFDGKRFYAHENVLTC